MKKYALITAICAGIALGSTSAMAVPFAGGMGDGGGLAIAGALCVKTAEDFCTAQKAYDQCNVKKDKAVAAAEAKGDSQASTAADKAYVNCRLTTGRVLDEFRDILDQENCANGKYPGISKIVFLGIAGPAVGISVKCD